MNDFKLDKKIDCIFSFLEENHSINKNIQQSNIGQNLCFDTVEQNSAHLLYKVYNTQSQPKLDCFLKFIKKAYEDKALESFDAFKEHIFTRLEGNQKTDGSLFQGLSKTKGWGPKTAALLIRNLAIINSDPSLAQRFWKDLYSGISNEQIYLPVDSVIEFIFYALSKQRGAKLGFKKINDYLIGAGRYTNEQMIVWDDLWFWGFITQTTQKDGSRILGWNEAKYWSQFNFPKSKEEIDFVKGRSRQFIKLINR